MNPLLMAMLTGILPRIEHNHMGATVAGTSLPITPSDTVDLPQAPCNGVQVGGAGTVKFMDRFGNIDTHTKTADSVIPVRIRRVFSTGTSATDLHALY